MTNWKASGLTWMSPPPNGASNATTRKMENMRVPDSIAMTSRWNQSVGDSKK